jgi:hypothetical protein
MSRSGMVGGRVLCAVRGGAACELVDEAWREAKEGEGTKESQERCICLPFERLPPRTMDEDDDQQLSSFKHLVAFTAGTQELLALDLDRKPTKQQHAQEGKVIASLCAIVSTSTCTGGRHIYSRSCCSSTSIRNSRTSSTLTSNSSRNLSLMRSELTSDDRARL